MFNENSNDIIDDEADKVFAICQKFWLSLYTEPNLVARDPIIGVGKNRLCFCNRDKKPNWARGWLNVNAHRPRSTRDMHIVFGALESRSLNALVDLIITIRDIAREGATLYSCVRYEQFKAIIEADLRVLTSKLDERLALANLQPESA